MTNYNFYNLKIQLFAGSLLILFLLLPNPALAKLNIVSTTTDLAAIAEEVGGSLVEVNFICRGYQDPHYVDPKPSFMRLMNRADLLLYHGLDLEGTWLPQIIEGSRNRKVRFGQMGNLDMSLGIDPILEIPQGIVDRSMGDIHPFGNPHYSMDPVNGMTLADSVAERLSILDPDNEKTYHANADAFKSRVASKLKGWHKKLHDFEGTRIATYHRSWSYFFHRFGLKYLGNIEIRPGILPSPRHLAELSVEMKRRKSKLILNANYYPPKWAELLAKKSGGSVAVLPVHIKGEPQVNTYIELIDYLVDQIADKLSGNAGK